MWDNYLNILLEFISKAFFLSMPTQLAVSPCLTTMNELVTMIIGICFLSRFQYMTCDWLYLHLHLTSSNDSAFPACFIWRHFRRHAHPPRKKKSDRASMRDCLLSKQWCDVQTKYSPCRPKDFTSLISSPSQTSIAYEWSCTSRSLMSSQSNCL